MPAWFQPESPVVSYAKLPLSFEANQGQTDARVKFLSRGPGYTLFLTSDEVALELQDSGSRIQDSVRAKRSGTLSALRRTTDHGQADKGVSLASEACQRQSKCGCYGRERASRQGQLLHRQRSRTSGGRTCPPTPRCTTEGVYPGVDLGLLRQPAASSSTTSSWLPAPMRSQHPAAT